MYISTRVPDGGSPNAVTVARRKRLASGLPLTDLADANPTHWGLASPEALAALADASAHGLADLYAPDPHGLLAARESLATNRGGAPRDYFLAASTSEIYGWLLEALCEPGDAIAVPVPGYPLLEALARLHDVRLVPYRLEYAHPSGWRVDVDSLLRAAAQPRVRAVVVVSPGNPTGAYLSAAERTAVVEVCTARGLPLIADEVFHPFALDIGQPPAAIAGESGCLTFALDGLSKLVGLPQAKLGWLRISGPDAAELDVARSATEMVADTYLSVSGLAMAALPEIVTVAPLAVDRIRARTGTNLAGLRAALEDARSPYRVRRCDGGWMALIDVPRYADDETLTVALIDAGIGVHPGYFYDLPADGTLAVALLANPDAFAWAAGRLREVIDSLA